MSVTADDIRRGQRKSIADCPVAIAVERACGKLDWCGHKWVTRAGRATQIWLPPEAQEFIEVFDEIGEGEPFEFDIEV